MKADWRKNSCCSVNKGFDNSINKICHLSIKSQQYSDTLASRVLVTHLVYERSLSNLSVVDNIANNFAAERIFRTNSLFEYTKLCSV